MPFSPLNPNPNGRRIAPDNAAIRAATQGGITLQKKKEPVPVPWDAFVALGLYVYRDGELQPALFSPQHPMAAGEVFETLRLLVAGQGKKSGPLAWETVPPEIQRHFKFQDEGEIATS